MAVAEREIRMFEAILIAQDAEGYRAAVADVAEDRLPAGDVTVRVLAGTLN